MEDAAAMYDLYYWTTPNGHKITLFLEEAGLPYSLKPVNISKGEQFEPAFLAISPNNRIPALVDHAPADGGAPLSLFESGAILDSLAEKTGQFLPTEVRARTHVRQWLHWQMGGLGPMLGQTHHFRVYAPEKVPYAIHRYETETKRLYGVLERRLAESPWVGGEAYSIADMACFPWIQRHPRQGIELEAFPAVKRWYDTIWSRPATQAAYALADRINTTPTVSDDLSRQVLFGQGPQD